MSIRAESLYEDYVWVRKDRDRWRATAIALLALFCLTCLYFFSSPDAMNVNKVIDECNRKIIAMNEMVEHAPEPQCPGGPLNITKVRT